MEASDNSILSLPCPVILGSAFWLPFLSDTVALVASFHSTTMSFFPAALVSLAVEKFRGGVFFWEDVCGDGFSNAKSAVLRYFYFCVILHLFATTVLAWIQLHRCSFVRLKGLDAVEESLHRLVILKFRGFAPAMKSLGYFNAHVFPIGVASEGL